MRAFPKELAKTVSGRWDNMVAGDYVTPPKPSDRLLREFLETVYLAAAKPEEGRYPQFNIVAVSTDLKQEDSSVGDVWRFTEPRPFSVDEIHRLAPAVDFKKSAIFAEWHGSHWQIAGLVDLGTWNRARTGLQYHYRIPPCLFVQIDRPGRLRVYQGQFLVAALVDGRLEQHKGIDFQFLLGTQAHNGLKKIWREISYPKIEEPREYEDFQFIAFWNVFAAIANCISESEHGGAIVIAPDNKSLSANLLQVKYRQDSPKLRNAFIDFMNTRHRVADFWVRIEQGDTAIKGDCAIAELELVERQARLVEAIRFVARLSGCDGAILISDDLRILGFGTEIRAELKKGTKIRQSVNDLQGTSRPLNVEQFGQRHRSAIKLVSRKPKYAALVISQDGPISFISSDRNSIVTVKKRNNLVNMNMPWA